MNKKQLLLQNEELNARLNEARQELQALQRKILGTVEAYVKPGGTLVYSTCTVLRRENEDIVNAFLEAHPEFHPECFDAPEGAGLGTVSMATLLPQRNGTDGFFICRLRRDR